MKTIKTHALACLAAVCLLVNMVSCSSYIPITMAVPAQLNLRRGAKISLNYNGRYSDLVVSEFAKIVRADGYYTIVPRWQSDYDLSWQDEYDKYDRSYLKGAKFTVRQGGILLDYWYCGTVSYSAARACYNVIAPHEEVLKMYPKPETPELEKAVEMCKIEQWGEAKNYIQEAMTKHPDDPENYYLQAIMNIKVLNYDAADDLLRKAYHIKQDKRYLRAIENNAVMRKNDEAVKRQLSAE